MQRIIAALVLAGLALPAVAAERRCGWLHNPGPAGWWLDDRDGRWEIWTQGRLMPESVVEITRMTAQDWVRPQGNYGYGCACLTVEVDLASQRVLRVLGSRQLPIARCSADRSLPSPE